MVCDFQKICVSRLFPLALTLDIQTNESLRSPHNTPETGLRAIASTRLNISNVATNLLQT